MANQNLQTLKGFRDFLPEQMAIRNRVKKILVDVFESFGFEPLSTPSLEYADLLLGKYGDEADKLVYTFEDNGGRKVGMPYDLTVPTSRVVAQYANTLALPFKRYQIQRVWRAENTQKGRYREFEQCDADIIGSPSPDSDAEILAVIYTAASRLNLGEFKIKLNSRALLYDLFTQAGFAQEKFNGAAISVDKLDKKSADEVKVELIEKGLSSESIEKFFDITNKLDQTYPDGQALAESTELIAEVPSENFVKLQQIVKLAIEMGVDPLAIIPTFTLARGLDYYTGAIFETVVTEPKIGSISGGGRYDKLINQLGGPELAAVGMSFGFDRICDVISQLGLWKDIPVSPTQILITVFSPDLAIQSIKLAKLLRESGINAEVYLETDAKLEKQLKYADKKQIPWAVILGPEELKNDQIVLKNLKTSTQEIMPRVDLAAKIR